MRRRSYYRRGGNATFDNLTNAFKALRKAGYFARQNFWCCQSCGWAAVPEGKGDKVVFYHNQDNARKVDGESFHLAWSGDGGEIVRILEENGVKVEWDGSPDTRIKVLGDMTEQEIAEAKTFKLTI